MAAEIDGAMVGNETCIVIKVEPVELDIEYEAPSAGEAAVERWNIPTTACPASVACEPLVKTEPTEYPIDITEADVKQESAEVSGTAHTLENPHLMQDTPPNDVRSTIEIEIANPSSLLQMHLEGSYRTGNKNLNEYSQEWKLPNAGETSQSMCIISGNRSKLNRPNNSRFITSNPSKPIPNCPECNESFSELVNYKKHMIVHSGKKLHTCPECGKTFIKSSSLDIHKRFHTGEKPHSCPQCGKCFHLPGDFRAHMRIHTGEKPYTCRECGKSFHQSGNLNSHMRTHTGVKPYTCTECGKSFNRSDHLNTHRKIHTGEKAHACRECGKAFSQTGHLNTHMKIHAPKQLG